MSTALVRSVKMMNSKRHKIIVVCVLFGAALCVTDAFATRGSYDRYQPIVDRKPFGALPEKPVATGAVVVPPEPQFDADNPPKGAFIETLRICAMTETDFGLRVGIVDIKSKPQAVYFLYAGESENGIAVVEADYANERALLRKNDETYWLGMNDVGGASAPAVAAKTVAKAGVTKRTGSKRLSYADRLSRRRKLEADRMEALRKPVQLTGEALQEHLRQMQMDAIRTGKPPLPIPLTREMDDQLVQEGVLPPIE
ncbi:MAG: hypothetical protein OSB41_13220 [Kiritimatiellae bacterium]|nr:hypothetical protein [Kiritimatiellia bacterium]